VSRNCGSFDISQTCGPPCPVTVRILHPGKYKDVGETNEKQYFHIARCILCALIFNTYTLMLREIHISFPLSLLKNRGAWLIQGCRVFEKVQ
jgi:hypothetical protein